VLRLLRGEPVDAVSREVSVPIYKLERGRDRALAGIDAGLKERENDPVERHLDEANRRIGELGHGGRDSAQGKADEAPFGQPEVVAMSRETSTGTGKPTSSISSGASRRASPSSPSRRPMAWPSDSTGR